jgi:AcrR family transcriptional regulator
MAKPAKAATAKTRVNDPEKTRADILTVASRHFAEHGLSGARVDEIAELTNTSKRMIYYYFESKQGLYQAVLERAYLGIRRIETDMDLDKMTALEALESIVRFTFDYHFEHQEFIRLVTIENIHRAENLRQIPGIREHNAAVITQLSQLVKRGEASGQFRQGIDPVELHWMISAFAVFNVSNDATFTYLYDHDGSKPDIHAARREMVTLAISRWCRA